jgi:hypothetical protein
MLKGLWIEHPQFRISIVNVCFMCYCALTYIATASIVIASTTRGQLHVAKQSGKDVEYGGLI